MKDIFFSKAIDLSGILEKYGFNMDSVGNMQIGYDKNIYVLAKDKKESALLSVVVIEPDWEEETVKSDYSVYLGKHDPGFYFVQPNQDNLLIVDCRCCYNHGNPDQNAIIYDTKGNEIKSFCLGDGINCLYTRADGTFVTGYFDEGVFGNLGWDVPIGAPGVIVWDEMGNHIKEASHNIWDCYAMNIDDSNNIWYYYYDEFKLIKDQGNHEFEYEPGIIGADIFFISADEQTALFNGGYNETGTYRIVKLVGHKDEHPEKIMFRFMDSKPDSIFLISAYGSYAVFHDANERIFIRRFINI
jgi:hypothetical protein